MIDELDMREVFAAFLVEARELVEALEQGLLQLEQGQGRGDPELINALFRAAHTIKGSGGIVGIDSLVGFTHHVETLLDRVRAGEPLLDGPTLSNLLRCVDHIRLLIDRAEAGDTQALDLKPQGDRLLATLALPGSTLPASAPAATSPSAQAAAGTPSGGYRLFAAFAADCLIDGMDPSAALNYLGEQSPASRCVLLTGLVPTLAELDPESCYIAVGLQAATGTPAQARAALEFFGEGNTIAVLPPGEPAATVHTALQALAKRLGPQAGQDWQDAGLLTHDEWHGPAAVDTPPTAEPAPGKAVAAPAAAPAKPARFVRVPAERLDELILQVGELVIAGAGVDLLARQTRQGRLQEAVNHLAQLIDSIQAGALQMRMVPIGETFNRFQRVVRDVSQELGKQIALDIVGGETELDKAMVERIGDPLMHLVRNAMDHGLETPAEREAHGKPSQGTLRLRAFHDSGNVVVEVSDDGRGLGRERIVAKAVSRGLIASGEGLSDHEVFQLIFEPGFSTAEQVTNLSGRGVGMDVVKKSVEGLRGTITLSSRPGEGTLVQMRLPLTLAIIDGFMVGVGDARFILPLDLVVECIELPSDALSDGSPRYLNLRGEVLPYVCLRQHFSVPGSRSKRPSVVVVRSGELKTGVLVDTLHGEIQTVIKPLGVLFQHLRAVSGTSILGSGDIALILDVHQLVQGSVDRASRAMQPDLSTG